MSDGNYKFLLLCAKQKSQYNFPASILYKSTAGRLSASQLPWRAENGPL